MMARRPTAPASARVVAVAAATIHLAAGACLGASAPAGDAAVADPSVSFAISIEVMLFIVAVVFAVLIAGFFAIVLIRQGGLDGDGRPPDECAIAGGFDAATDSAAVREANPHVRGRRCDGEGGA